MKVTWKRKYFLREDPVLLINTVVVVVVIVVFALLLLLLETNLCEEHITKVQILSTLNSSSATSNVCIVMLANVDLLVIFGTPYVSVSIPNFIHLAPMATAYYYKTVS